MESNFDLKDLTVGDYVYVKGLLNHCVKAEAVGFIEEISEFSEYGSYNFPYYYGKNYIFIRFYKDKRKYSAMLFVNIHEIYKLYKQGESLSLPTFTDIKANY